MSATRLLKISRCLFPPSSCPAKQLQGSAHAHLTLECSQAGFFEWYGSKMTRRVGEKKLMAAPGQLYSSSNDPEKQLSKLFAEVWSNATRRIRYSGLSINPQPSSVYLKFSFHVYFLNTLKMERVQICMWIWMYTEISLTEKSPFSLLHCDWLFNS